MTIQEWIGQRGTSLGQKDPFKLTKAGSPKWWSVFRIIYEGFIIPGSFEITFKQSESHVKHKRKYFS